MSPKGGFDCTPDINIFYCWVYIVIAVSLASWLLVPKSIASDWPGLSLLAVHGIILVAGIFAAKKLDFTGQWATVFLVSGLLLWLLPATSGVFLWLILLSDWMWSRRWPQVA